MDSQDFAQEDRSRIVELVRKWGGSTTDAVLDPANRYFSAPGIPGVIGYRTELGNFTVFGDPICPQEEKARLSSAFHKFAEEQGMGVIYIAASQVFAKWAIQNVSDVSIAFGEELSLEPANDPRKYPGDSGSLVRRKVKHAGNAGVTVHEYLGNDLNLEQSIKEVGVLWLKTRHRMQIHISNIHLFEDRLGKRWFYAKQGERIVGTVTLNQLQEKEGCHMNHLMVTPDAPHGTSEFLVVSALEALAKDHCKVATVGMVSTKSLGEIVGLNPFSTWLARSVFALARRFAHLDGLNTFWSKFHPKSAPSYLLFSKHTIGYRELISLLHALHGPIFRRKHG